MSKTRFALVLAAAFTSLAASAASADPLPSYLGVGTSLKADGGNPLDGKGPLLYLPLQLELGWRVGAATELHVGAGYGTTVSLAEGGGSFGQATAGARYDFYRGERTRLGVDLSLGWSRSEFENKNIVATTDGLIAEPSLQLGVRLTDALSLSIGFLARAEWLVGDVRYEHDYLGGLPSSEPASDSRHALQLGAGASAMLRYAF